MHAALFKATDPMSYTQSCPLPQMGISTLEVGQEYSDQDGGPNKPNHKHGLGLSIINMLESPLGTLVSAIKQKGTSDGNYQP